MKTMKGMDIFCGSPASTAICSSIDQRSMVRRSHRSSIDQHHQQGPRDNLLDHHHHHDHHRRIKNQNQHQQPRHHHVPCSSQLPINPRPAYHNYEKSRKSCSDNYNLVNNNNINEYTGEVRRKSSVDVYDLKSRRTTSPPGSSRYLLSERTSNFIDWSSETDCDRVQRVVSGNDGDGQDQQTPKLKFRSLSTNDQGSSLRVGSSFNRSRHQVVVLKVSLHCKGCEGKVRKHLSKMEGVTSFSVDFAEKKVTIIGDITPLGVLASVSKVKNAQLWPSPASSSSPSLPWSA